MTRRQQSIVTWMLIAGGIAGTGWLLYLTANLLWYYATGFIEADILIFLPAPAAWCAWDAARDASKAGRALCVLVALLGVDPPPCAEPFLPLPQFTTIFRKK
jgi:hypothetical protein